MELIEKEQISSLRFPKEEVELTPEQKKTLQKAIDRATSLGNIEHIKFKITFKDDKSLKQVHTTIWAANTQHIVLKKGVVIPVNRILDIN